MKKFVPVLVFAVVLSSALIAMNINDFSRDSDKNYEVSYSESENIEATPTEKSDEIEKAYYYGGKSAEGYDIYYRAGK